MSSCCCGCGDGSDAAERRSSYFNQEKAMRLFADKYEYCMVFKMSGPVDPDDPSKFLPFDEKAVDLNGDEGNQMPNAARVAIRKMLEASMTVFTYLSTQKDELYVLITAEDEVIEEFADDKDYVMLLDEFYAKELLSRGDKSKCIKPAKIIDEERFTKWRPFDFVYGKWESGLQWQSQNPVKGFALDPHTGLPTSSLEVTYPQESARKIYYVEEPTAEAALLGKTSSPFSRFHRLKLVYMMITSAPGSNGAGISVLSGLSNGEIASFFPLHDPDKVETMLNDIWHVCRLPWHLNFDEIREYFGEKVAFFFVFTGHYSKWLVFPSIVGLAFQLVVWSTGPNYSHPVLPFFGAFICVWSTFMLEYWKREQNTKACHWGMSEFESKEVERPDFKGEQINSFIDGKPYLYYPPSLTRNKQTASFFVLSFLTLIVIGAVAGIYVLKFALTDTLGDNASTVASVVNTVQITIFNYLYTELARKLAHLENPRTDTIYQDSLISKLFAFRFVNSYASFFFIAFIAANLSPPKNADPSFLGQCGDTTCMKPLSINLAIIFGTSITITNLIDIVTVYATWKLKIRDETKGVDKELLEHMTPPETNYMLMDYDVIQDSIECFADTAIQFGYSVLFIVALPVACFCALVSNYVKIKLQAWKQLKMFHRPIPQGAQDIGSWQSIFYIVSAMGVCTNGALICFTMDILWYNSEIRDPNDPNFQVGHVHARANFSLVGRLWIFIGFIISLLFLQVVAMEVVPDVPAEVEIQLARQAFIVSKLIEHTPDEDFDDGDSDDDEERRRREEEEEADCESLGELADTKKCCLGMCSKKVKKNPSGGLLYDSQAVKLDKKGYPTFPCIGYPTSGNDLATKVPLTNDSLFDLPKIAAEMKEKRSLYFPWQCEIPECRLLNDKEDSLTSCAKCASKNRRHDIEKEKAKSKFPAPEYERKHKQHPDHFTAKVVASSPRMSVVYQQSPQPDSLRYPMSMSGSGGASGGGELGGSNPFAGSSALSKKKQQAYSSLSETEMTPVDQIPSRADGNNA